MQLPVYLAFATGRETATAAFLDRVARSNPDSTLLIVARQRPPDLAGREWIKVTPRQRTAAIVRSCRAAIAGREIRGAAIHATRRGGEWALRLAALRLAGRDLRIYNDHLDHFRLGDRAVLWEHLKWRWRERRRIGLWWNLLAILAMVSAAACRLTSRVGFTRGQPETHRSFSCSTNDPGISVIIPTRDGRDLLAAMLPAVTGDLASPAAEIIAIDNASFDGTAEFLRKNFPQVCIVSSQQPLSFSAAVNRGIAVARYSHVVLLNNDMRIEPGFFAALRGAFDHIPDLFCATAQIFFPPGQRREETGLCFWHRDPGDDFPIYCAEPDPREDGTLVLYGSGGCSMYDKAKLRVLGGFDETYAPAYVEDLDIGYRAWQRGWPTVFCAGARVEHRHRATTSRYYDREFLDYLVERNYLRFLVRATGDIFPELWRDAIVRLKNRASTGDRAARRALSMAWREVLSRAAPPGSTDERSRKQSLTR